MTDWPDAIRRGVEALDFNPAYWPGQGDKLRAVQARPPADPDGLHGMFAAEQFHNMLPIIALSVAIPPIQAAEDVRRQALAAVGADQVALIRRYRFALAAALEAYVTAGEGRIPGLLKWREQDRKAVD